MDFDKSVQQILTNKSINFKDRNKSLINKKALLTEELEKHLKKNVDNVYNRKKWLEAQKRKNIFMNMTD